MYPPSIQKLIELFSKFPTVGPRTAARFVFYLLKLSKEEVENIISAISELKSKIKICKFCLNPFQGEPAFAKATVGKEDLCQICSNPSREKSLLCILANETDLQFIEKTQKYNGLYFILGGTVLTLKKTDLEKLRINDLQEKIKSHPEIKEIILAFNPTAEGEATILYLKRLLKPLNIKITRLGRGLPVGGELEYADEETLSSAFESRR